MIILQFDHFRCWYQIWWNDSLWPTEWFENGYQKNLQRTYVFSTLFSKLKKKTPFQNAFFAGLICIYKRFLWYCVFLKNKYQQKFDNCKFYIENLFSHSFFVSLWKLMVELCSTHMNTKYLRVNRFFFKLMMNDNFCLYSFCKMFFIIKDIQYQRNLLYIPSRHTWLGYTTDID